MNTMPSVYRPLQLHFEAVGRAADALDPSYLASRITSLVELLQDWEFRAGTTFENARYVSAHHGELVRQLQRHVVLAETMAAEALLLQKEPARESTRWSERFSETQGHLSDARDESQALLRKARAAVQGYEDALSQARRELEEAEEEEALAEQHLDDCRDKLREAERDLEEAEDELRDAENRTEYDGRDSNGNEQRRPVDTSSYERAVELAQECVSDCEDACEDAKHAHDEAVEERQAASQCVSRCERALELGEEACAEGETALEECGHTEGVVARINEELQRLGQIELALRQTAASLEAAMAQLQQAFNQASADDSAAQEFMQQAHKQQEEARQLASRARHEIQDRVQVLLTFDAALPSSP